MVIFVLRACVVDITQMNDDVRLLVFDLTKDIAGRRLPRTPVTYDRDPGLVGKIVEDRVRDRLDGLVGNGFPLSDKVFGIDGCGFGPTRITLGELTQLILVALDFLLIPCKKGPQLATASSMGSSVVDRRGMGAPPATLST